MQSNVDPRQKALRKLDNAFDSIINHDTAVSSKAAELKKTFQQELNDCFDAPNQSHIGTAIKAIQAKYMSALKDLIFLTHQAELHREVDARFDPIINDYRQQGFTAASQALKTFKEAFQDDLRQYLNGLNQDTIQAKTEAFCQAYGPKLDGLILSCESSGGWYRTPDIFRAFIGVFLCVLGVLPFFLVKQQTGVLFFDRPSVPKSQTLITEEIQEFTSDIIRKFNKIITDPKRMESHPEPLVYDTEHLQWTNEDEKKLAWNEAKERLIYRGVLGDDDQMLNIRGRNFIILDRKILVMGHHLPPEKQGVYGTVSFAEDENGGLWVVKDSQTNLGLESNIGVDLGVSLKSSHLKYAASFGRTCHRLASIYVGITLAEYINEGHLDRLKDDERLDLIRNILQSIEDWQKGVHSTENRLLIHNDLHLRNITIDSSRKAHLIDYGSSFLYYYVKKTENSGLRLYNKCADRGEIKDYIYLDNTTFEAVDEYLKLDRACDLKVIRNTLFNRIITDTMKKNNPKLQDLVTRITSARTDAYTAGDLLEELEKALSPESNAVTLPGNGSPGNS